MDRYPLQQLPFWGRLEDRQRQMLEQSVRRMEYCSGQIVRSPGRDCLGALLIQRGAIRIYLLSQEGREATIARMTAGEVCVLSASCMLSAITFDVEMMAQEETEVLVIPVQVLSQLMQENLYVENFVYKTAAERFSDAISAVERMLFLTLEQRVVVYLLQEADRRGEETLRLTQEQMAQAIGSAREAVTRTLKKLSDAGLVELFRGGVRILDRAALEERS